MATARQENVSRVHHQRPYPEKSETRERSQGVLLASRHLPRWPRKTSALERRTCVTERVGMPSTWHLWLKSSRSFKETAVVTFKPSSKGKVKSWPRRAEISAGRHEEECPDGPRFPMGTGLAQSFLLRSSWDKNLLGSALPGHGLEQAQHGKHSRKPFGQSQQETAGEKGKKPPTRGLPTLSATGKGDQLGLSLQNSSLLAKAAPSVPPSPHPALSEDTHLSSGIPTYW